MATKIILNGTERTLSPFSYKDRIAAFDKSTLALVRYNGETCFKSAVTKGTSKTGGTKYHVYFQPSEGAEREWMPITLEEYTAHQAGLGLAMYEVDFQPAAEPTPIQDVADAAAKVIKGRKAKRKAEVEEAVAA